MEGDLPDESSPCILASSASSGTGDRAGSHQIGFNYFTGVYLP
jgi:hypothetical protein